MQHVSKMWKEGRTPPIPQMPFRAEDRQIREAMALTAGMITMIDDQIGRVVQALKEAGTYENTVIIFTSDHGDYMGDFNILLKGPLHFPSITRVPMIWSDPATRTGATTDALASTIDLPASILERAGFAPYNGMQGQSFLAVMQGGAAPRDAVLIEHHDGGPRMGMAHPTRARTLRTKDWRMSLFATEGWGELYDLRADPDETHNLWDDPAYAVQRGTLAIQMAREMTLIMDESPLANRLA